ncbi:cell envelope integrity protein TolA [Undibacterium sp.]|uniref:cell envelope integrity protein TolA n=1 Tax=Undibacterium sp. TaxID=1914977 RepID=UPI00374CE665
MTAFSPNALPKEPGRMPAIALAIVMHALLFTFLWFGVQWQNQESTAVEAEVWDMQTREAAPKPVPQEEVAPEPVKVQPPPPPPVVKPDEPKADPEIALEQERKRKLAEKKKEEEKLKLEQARLQAERDDELRKQKEKEKEKLKLAEDKKKADEKKADEKKADELAAKDADKKKQDELKKKQADQTARDKVFAENMRRLNGQAATTGSGGNGDAPRSTGNNRGDPSYAAKVIAKIRSNNNYSSSDSSSDNPTVEYRIDLLPDGTLRGAIRKLKSSGLPGFDEAVERAIDKSQPFPRNNSGVVPDSMIVVYKLKE